MLQLIISIFFLIILAVLMALNLRHNTTFNLFGWLLQDIPVMIVVMFSFVLGVVQAFIFYLVYYFGKMNKHGAGKPRGLFRDRKQEPNPNVKEPAILHTSSPSDIEHQSITSRKEKDG